MEKFDKGSCKGSNIDSGRGLVTQQREKSGTDPVIEPLAIEMDLAGSLSDVWHALTTSEGARAFLQCEAHIELRVGGAYELLFDTSQPTGSRGSETCTILSFLPQRIMSFTWNAPPQFAHARNQHTWVVIELEPMDAQRTSIRLTHMGWKERMNEHPAHKQEWIAARDYFRAAWPRFLGALDASLALRSSSA